VEAVRWRTSQRGNRYMLVNLSDRSGQFQASCFDEAACMALETLAGEGGCALLDCELDWREGEETPRAAVRQVRPLDRLMRESLLEMVVRVDSDSGFSDISAILHSLGKGRGALLLELTDLDQPLGMLHLGDGFALDQDLVHRIERLSGVAEVTLRLKQERAAARSATVY
jgi:DNA polymerase III subunit alpha